jgi:UDP-glucose 4-epimerase
MEIVDVLKEIYPDLEFTFLNQHLNLRQLRVSPESRLRNYINYDNKNTFLDELIDFKNRFSF